MTETVLRMIEAHARAGRGIALSGPGAVEASYADLFAGIAARAKSLGDEEAIVLVASRQPEAAVWLLAGLAAGCTVLPFDPRQGAGRLSSILSRFADPLVACDRTGAALIGRVEGGQQYRAAQLDDDVPPPRQKAESMALPGPAIVLATSGSTGQSKLVPIPETELLDRAGIERDWFGLGSADVTLGLLPWSFDVGLTQLFSTLLTGARHHLVASWLPQDIASAASGSGASGMAATPAIWSTLLALDPGHPAWAALAGLRFATVSGGDIGAEAVLEVDRRLGGGKLFKTYGQTEFFRITSLRPEQLPGAPGSVGPGYPGVRIEIRDDEDQPCPPSVPGEVVASGAGRMPGYLGEAAAADGPHRTGDIGRIDADGRLTLLGRRDTLIKRMDQRVHLEELEAQARAAVGATVIFTVPRDGAFSGQLVACLSDPAWSGHETELVKRLRPVLAAPFLPDRVHWIEALPQTATGKPDRVRLAAYLENLKQTPLNGPAERA
ncbi:AMP-binding protein [Rhodobacterales bacterium HKCCE3408]|nr:AMP-binding protein [Rhodobacterales bacterium HKCCE3408]